MPVIAEQTFRVYCNRAQLQATQNWIELASEHGARITSAAEPSQAEADGDMAVAYHGRPVNIRFGCAKVGVDEAKSVGIADSTLDFCVTLHAHAQWAENSAAAVCAAAICETVDGLILHPESSGWIAAPDAIEWARVWRVNNHRLETLAERYPGWTEESIASAERRAATRGHLAFAGAIVGLALMACTSSVRLI